MSALGELWQWLQGKTTRTKDRDASSVEQVPRQQGAADLIDGAAKQQQAQDIEARIQRHARDRSGPWQMK